MTKYNQKLKQQVVDFYFEHHENLSHTLRHFGFTSKATVRLGLLSLNIQAAAFSRTETQTNLF